ncbi:MAG TPA: SRPBCC domain-containing protein, partial [Gemmatimonadales bacterium]|nr:SRPBCC domain-containing protein [Gemmatimonadales bacterium]
VVIRALPETVFRYFIDSDRFAAWWGAGSSIEPRAGGLVRIRYPNGAIAIGEILEIQPPWRVSFTYGYLDQPMVPPGGSRVTFTLEPHAEGTLLSLRHDFAESVARDEHRQGWGYQLALFANVVATEAYQDAPDTIDRYFAAWNEADGPRRSKELAALAAPGVVFRDRFGATAGSEELAGHIGAVRVHMPGLRLERDGDIRHCQGTALAEWVAVGPDGSTRARGTSVFDFAPDGRIARVVGLWNG